MKFAFGREKFTGLSINGLKAANENVSRKWPLARDVRVKWPLTEAGPFTEYSLEMQKKIFVSVWIYCCSGNVVTQSQAENSRCFSEV